MAVGSEPPPVTPQLELLEELELPQLGVELLSTVLLLLGVEGVGMGWETPLGLPTEVEEGVVVGAEIGTLEGCVTAPLLAAVEVEKKGLCAGLNASGLIIETPSSSEERCLFLSSSLSSVELHLEWLLRLGLGVGELELVDVGVIDWALEFSSSAPVHILSIPGSLNSIMSSKSMSSYMYSFSSKSGSCDESM